MIEKHLNISNLIIQENHSIAPIKRTAKIFHQYSGIRPDKDFEYQNNFSIYTAFFTKGDRRYGIVFNPQDFINRQVKNETRVGLFCGVIDRSEQIWYDLDFEKFYKHIIKKLEEVNKKLLPHD